MARQLDSERERLRSALAEMLSWVDGNLNAPEDEGSSVTNITDAQRPSGEVTQLRPVGLAAPLTRAAPGHGRPAARRTLRRRGAAVRTGGPGSADRLPVRPVAARQRLGCRGHRPGSSGLMCAHRAR